MSIPLFKTILILSVIAEKRRIVIDLAIDAPVHGKGVVDDLNAFDKGYLGKFLCLTSTPEVHNDEKRMNIHSMKEEGEFSFSEEYQCLCVHQDSIGSVNNAEDEGSSKYFSLTSSVDATGKNKKSSSISLAESSSSSALAVESLSSTSLAPTSARSSVEGDAFADTKEDGASHSKGASNPVDAGSSNNIIVSEGMACYLESLAVATADDADAAV